MKLSFVIGIYLTNIVTRSSVGLKNDDVVVILILVLWALYMRSNRKYSAMIIIDVRNARKIIPGITPGITTVTTPSTTTKPVPEARFTCLPNYTLYQGPGIEFRFQYFNQCLSRDIARRACKADGADLAIFDNESLPAFAGLMNAILQTPPRMCPPTFGIWLNAKTRVNDFVAEYSDGTLISSENPLWQAGSPFIANQCVEYVTDVNDQRKIRINHAPCESEAAYVCQQRR